MKILMLPPQKKLGLGPNLITLLLLAALMAAGIIAYANSFHAAMVLDDHPFIMDNTPVHMTRLAWDGIKKAALEGLPAHRYLPNISFALNYYFNGLNTFYYHVVNLVIHLLTGLCLFFFLRLTLKIDQKYPDEENAVIIAFFAALLWIVQPVGTQAVTYICQRMASMVALFYVLSLFLYVKGRMAMRRNPGKFTVPCLYFASCAVAALCALATKENAGTLPLIILLYEWFFFQDLKLHLSGNQLLFCLLFILAFGGAAVWYMGENPFARIMDSYRYRDFTLPQRVLTEFRIVVYYISLFFWAPPGRLNLDHDYPLSVSLVHPAATLISMIAVISLLAFAAYSAKKERLIAFCILWFFIAQATESTIIGIELIFEHRAYIPFMMTSLLFVLAVFRLIPNKKAAFGVLTLTALIFSLWTFERNQTWRDPVTFWTDSAAKSPEKWRPNYNLAKTLSDAGDINGAIAFYRNAIKINPVSVETLNNLAAALIQKGLADEALPYLRAALKTTPEEFNLHVNMGNALAKKGMTDLAVTQYELALKLNPQLVQLYIQTGNLLTKSGKLDEAGNLLNQGLKLFPDNADIRLEFANTQVYKGNLAEAIYQYETILKNRPDAKAAIDNRNQVLSKLSQAEQINLLFKTALRFSGERRYNSAIDLFQRILAVWPVNPLIDYNISCLYALQNNKAQAIHWLKQAMAHGYDNLEKLKSDPDMNNLRGEPYFKKVTGDK